MSIMSIKKYISNLIKKSSRLQQTSNGSYKYITVGDLISNIDCDQKDLIESIKELYEEKHIYFSKTLKDRYDNDLFLSQNNGSIYLLKEYKLNISKVITNPVKKVSKSLFKHILDMFFILILLVAVAISTNYSYNALIIIKNDYKIVCLAISFLISVISIIGNFFIRSAKKTDKLLILLGLFVFVIINMFCTISVTINEFEIDRVSINPNILKYQYLNTDLKNINDKIQNKNIHISTQNKLALEVMNKTNHTGNSSFFYERKARYSEKELKDLEKEKNIIEKQLDKLVNSSIESEKKRNSYQVISDLFDINVTIIVIVFAILQSFIFDVFCPFLIGYILSKKD